MKKVGIVTIIDNNNYGNRLQNYALQTFLNSTFDIETITLLNYDYRNDRKYYLLRRIKNIIFRKKYNEYVNEKRLYKFREFNKNIFFSSKIMDCYSDLSEYDFIIVGSDQVWNPKFRRLRDFDLLRSSTINNRIAYAASFGIDELSKKELKKINKLLDKFDEISVREDSGKKIIDSINIKKNTQVLIDPTMLLNEEEWNKVIKVPDIEIPKKYVLNYFLGDLSEERRKIIKKFADENNCQIINILDNNSPFFQTGPSEFLYLEKNAYIILTDSFHSSVFAMLFNRPFIIFDREQEGMAKMNSRLDTLISKFNLKNRKFEGIITEENLNHDYSEAYKILEVERQKSKDFLERALDIKK